MCWRVEGKQTVKISCADFHEQAKKFIVIPCNITAKCENIKSDLVQDIVEKTQDEYLLFNQGAEAVGASSATETADKLKAKTFRNFEFLKTTETAEFGEIDENYSSAKKRAYQEKKESEAWRLYQENQAKEERKRRAYQGFGNRQRGPAPWGDQDSRSESSYVPEGYAYGEPRASGFDYTKFAYEQKERRPAGNYYSGGRPETDYRRRSPVGIRALESPPPVSKAAEAGNIISRIIKSGDVESGAIPKGSSISQNSITLEDRVIPVRKQDKDISRKSSVDSFEEEIGPIDTGYLQLDYERASALEGIPKLKKERYGIYLKLLQQFATEAAAAHRRGEDYTSTDLVSRIRTAENALQLKQKDRAILDGKRPVGTLEDIGHESQASIFAENQGDSLILVDRDPDRKVSKATINFKSK